MPLELVEKPSRRALPVHLVAKGDLESLDPVAAAWARANNFSGDAGKVLLLPGPDGALAGALLGMGDGETSLHAGALAKVLPEG